MKKLFAIFLAVVMCLSFAACGNKEEEFKTSYLTLYQELQDLKSDCDKLSGQIYEIWNIVGTDNVMGTLTYMLEISDNFDDYWDNEDDRMGIIYECKLAKEYGWLNNYSFGISYERDAKEFHAMCMEYKALIESVSAANNVLPDKIKALHSEYKEDFGDEYELINELYLEVSSYAEFSITPSGSMVSYSTNKADFQSNISKLIKAADIY